MQEADFVDAVHEAPYLRHRRPGKSVNFVKGFQPLLDFKGLDLLRDGFAEAIDEIVADIRNKPSQIWRRQRVC